MHALSRYRFVWRGAVVKNYPNWCVCRGRVGSVLLLNWRRLKCVHWRLPHRFWQDHFKPIGHVQFVEIPEDAQGRSKGHGTVRFANEQDATRAIAQLNNSELGGRPIFVREDQQA